jgi:arsenate reductase (thioredoxin)
MTTSPSMPPAFITAPPRCVLFLCYHNSARSQMAEGFARALAPRDAEVMSAGVEPSRVHPMAIEVMREVGIDISGQRSKHLDDVPWRNADTVVTVCGEAEGICPTVETLVRRRYWPLPDPSAAPESDLRAVFREVRDEIRWRVSCLWPRG